MTSRESAGPTALTLSTIGFPQHGKTCYTLALGLTLQRLSLVFNSHAMPADEFTRSKLKEMRKLALSVERPESTAVGHFEPLRIDAVGIPGVPKHRLHVHDLAGQHFTDTVAVDDQLAEIFRACRTIWFFVSLADLPRNERADGSTLSDLLFAYLQGLERVGAPAAGRTLLVVYSKCDIENLFGERFQDQLQAHLASDPFRTITTSQPVQSIDDFSFDAYCHEMDRTSEMLRRFTEGHPQGAELIRMAEARRMNVRFCAVSALGGSIEMQEEHDRYRVLDPFFWAVRDHADQRAVHVLVDRNSVEASHALTGCVSDLRAGLSDFATVHVHELGRLTTKGRQRLSNSRVRARAPLAGPLLDSFAPNDLALVVAPRPPVDLDDFLESSWSTRLLLAALDPECDSAWPQLSISPDEVDVNELVIELRTLVEEG